MSRIPVATSNAALVGGMFTTGTTYYWALHSADPGTTGASEFSGGTYARQASQISAPANGSIGNASGLSWTNLGTAAATFFSIWTAATGGSYVAGGQLNNGGVTAATINSAAGQLTIPVS